MKKKNYTRSMYVGAAILALLAGRALYGAKPGTAVKLPPFVPIPAPQLTLQSVSPFQLTGFMQTATVDNAADTFSGGTMTINGHLVTVPRNTLFQMPATAMTWQEMFKLAPAPYGPTQSGLALNDTPTPFATYEVTVYGNRVINGSSDKYVAGLIFLSQQSLNQGQGYINYIDYTKGEMWIGSTLKAQTGARVRINTPQGRYGIAQSPDPRFTSDEDNPTIRAATGYPMCVQRFDPATGDDSLCPTRNRPVDPVTLAFQTIVNFPAPSINLPATLPDATQQAPFEIGDYVTFNGTLVKDANCTPSVTNPCQYISAHTIVANLGLFTAPGTMPAYVAIESMLLGAAGNPNPLFPQEAVEKLRIDAFTTDPTQVLDVYAVDVDSCGKVSDRFYGSMDASGPPVGGLKGRGRLRTTVGNFLPATREMRVASRTFTLGMPVDMALPTAKTYANGLLAGQYHAPNFTFIFPENLVLGSPQVPLPFQEFPFLVDGSGPYMGSPLIATNTGTTPVGTLSQLSPWPGLSSPAAPAGCSNGSVIQAPFANAGSPQTVASGVTVNLDGSQSSDPNQMGFVLHYTWLQTGGPTVALLDNGFMKPYFTAPTVAAGASPAVLTFSLVVDNGFASSLVSTVNVTVLGQTTPLVNAGSPQLISSPSTPGATVAVTLNGSAVDPNGASAQPLSYQWTQTGGPAVTLTNANTAAASFLAPSMIPGVPAVTLTFQLTVTDKLKLSGSATTTVVLQPIPDVVTITAATYKLAGSKLSVTATSSITNGLPVLTLHIPGHPDVQMTFDPNLKTYNIVPSVITNPIPGSVSVTSSFGGAATSPLTAIK
jgi:hypothetical protein